MIVKIQVNLFSSNESQQIRSFIFELPVTKDIMDIMDERPKSFFKVKIVKKELFIIKEVEEQDW